MQAACPARARAAAAAGRSSHAARARRAAACMSRTNVQYERVDYKAVHAALPKMGKDVWNTTYYPTAEDARSDRRWVLLDAQDLVLGRLATEAAVLLRGKNVTEFHPAMDMGANVIIVNAEKVKVTGKKYEDKLYKRHSGRPGGMKVETYRKLQERIPERILEKAIKGMLPKGRLGRQLFTNLKVYKGPEHPHEAQNPEPMELPHCVFQGIYGGST